MHRTASSTLRHLIALLSVGLLGGPAHAVCGDGVIDPGEDCDVAVATSGCCAPDCTFEPVGTPCDVSPCTTDERCVNGDCEPFDDNPSAGCAPCQACNPVQGCIDRPRDFCEDPFAPRGAKLTVQDLARDESDRLMWKFTQGTANAALSPFGFPPGDDDVGVCLYDQSGQLLVRILAPGGATCATGPCWTPMPGEGFRYRDPARASDGLKVMKLRPFFGPGLFKPAKMSADAKGENLPPLPPLPLALPVRVQLHAHRGNCWQTEFTATGVIKNDATVFKGRSE